MCEQITNRYYERGDRMAYVTVPKDLHEVKNKVIFNLTLRQLLCFACAAAVGVPFYFLTKGWLGTSNAATGMVFLMLPAFIFAMYEKDGMPLEKVIFNRIRVRYLLPAHRPFVLPGSAKDSGTRQHYHKKKGPRRNAKK